MHKHTSGTWYLQEYTDEYTNIIRCNNRTNENLFIAYTPQNGGAQARANAQRVVDCVNAMDGIDDPQKLRQAWDICKELELDQAQKYKEQRDELLEVIKKAEQSMRQNRCCGYRISHDGQPAHEIGSAFQAVLKAIKNSENF